MRTAVLGLDIGTASTKAALFDAQGRELARARRPYRLHTPRPGWAELDPEELWAAVVGSIRAVVKAAGAGLRPAALALAAQSGSLLPLDAGGAPLLPFITWLDGRAGDLVEEWRAAGLAGRVRRISGWTLQAGLGLATIAWLRRARPELFAAARRFCAVNDFVVHRLTGRFVTNPSNAGGMQLLDIAAGRWSAALCALAGVAPEQLAAIAPSGAVIGPLTPEAARQTGLPPGTPLVNGGHDQGCTALALGVEEPGQALLACGTSWVVTLVVARRPEAGAVPSLLNVNAHPRAGRWTLSQSLGGVGAAFDWFVRTCCPSPAAPDAELAATTPGSDGLLFLPLTGGHDPPPGERGGGFVGLRLDHSRAHMARAILEGTAFELRRALDAMGQAGLAVERLWMVGGATRIALWPEIVAQAAGRPVVLTGYDLWPALGAALLAGVGAGLWGTAAEARSRFRRSGREIAPDERQRRLYDERLAAYRRAQRCLVGMEEQE